MVEIVRPETERAIFAEKSLTTVAYPSFDVLYLLFNLTDQQNRRLRHPLLGDRAMRQALAMAVDRGPLIRNAYDTLAAPAYGPFVRALWTSDTSLSRIPFDTAGARRMLDSLGWRDTNGDGIRERKGQPLRIGVAVSAVSTARRKMAVVLQDQWKRVGVDVRIQELDPASFVPVVMGGKFDVFIHLIHLDPTPTTLLQSWGNHPITPSNFGMYDVSRIDSLVTLASNEGDVAKSKALYRQAYETIIQDVPAIFVLETRNYAAVQRRFRIDHMRGDAWWATIPEWYVPVGERLPRDNVPKAK
jgi:peptide/nickel transport system substrate-binding protein